MRTRDGPKLPKDGNMGISEFTLHNVLRTYSRQERLGGVHRSRTRAGAAAVSADQVSLSPAGRKIQWVGSLAAELADRQGVDLSADERAAMVRSTTRELLARHRDEIDQDSVSPPVFEARLRTLYLG